jgi:MFS family permease
MDSATLPSERAANAAIPWWREIDGYQWKILAMTWMGFLFDLMDSTLYALVMAPALTELLGQTSSAQNIGWYGGMIFSIFLVGWALGGIVFGIVADYFGRKVTLMLTILIYAAFTGLAGIAGSWWELGIYRFLTGLGVGGEWAAGAALLAECWPERARAKGAAILQTSAAAGYFFAAFIYLLVGGISWRLVFFVGVVPAILVFFIRRGINESERWLAAQARAKAQSGSATSSQSFTLRQVFGPQLLRDTIVGSMLATIVNFGFWAVTSWVPALIQTRFATDPSLGGGVSAGSYVSYAIMILTLGALPGYFVVGWLADRAGRRPAFLVFFLGAAAITPFIFLGPWSLSQMMFLFPFLGFFTMGIYAAFPIYLPELYPTHLRTTGAGFCFNIGRVISAFGPLITGTVILYTGSFEYAITSLSTVYLLGPVTLLWARETRGQPLA